MYEDLNQRETEILLYIKKSIDIKGYPPTVREMCKALNIKSTSTVHNSLEKLEYKGYLRKDPSKPRALEILDKNNDFLSNKKKTVDIPVISRISHLEPILAYNNIEDTYPIPVEFAEGKSLFILKFFGENMINSGIFNGDYLIIEKKDKASNGDKVLALVQDQPTIKTIYIENDHYRLESDKNSTNSIIVKDLKILGVLLGVYRKL